MINHSLSSLFWYDVGKYGMLGLLLGVSWLSRQRWLPHRHDDYVSVSGYVHECSRCGRLPASAYRAGTYGLEAEPPSWYVQALRHFDSDGHAHSEPVRGTAEVLTGIHARDRTPGVPPTMPPEPPPPRPRTRAH